MNLIDSNQDGKISLGEFQEYTDKQQATQGDNRAQIEMGLEALDLNQDGNLDRSELPSMDQLPDDQWAMIMNLTDTNQDGKISFREYQEYSSKQQATQGDELGGSQVEGTGGQQGGFVLSATCDNKMKVFADGVLLASNNNWRETTDVTIPGDTAVITIESIEEHVVAGIIASGSNGLVTDSSWKCGTTGTSLSDWNYAYEIGIARPRPRIASNASWIWDSSETWNTGKFQRVSCQKNLATWALVSRKNNCWSNCGNGKKGGLCENV